jgi:hypothetical protein
MKRSAIVLAVMLGGVSGSLVAQTTVTTTGGTSGYVPTYTGSATIANSVITQSGSNVGIGSNAPTETLVTNGAIRILPLFPKGSGNGLYLFSDGTNAFVASYGPNTTTTGNVWLSSYRSDGSGGYNMAQFSPAQITFNAPLNVSGNVKLTGGSGASITFADGTTQSTAFTGVLCGGDYAEAKRAEGGKSKYEPGDVLVLTADQKSDVQKSTEPYSTMVAGIFATKPGVIGRREARGKSSEDLPMAMVGVVPTKVAAENGPIHKGDLLVTSSTFGYAMKGTDRNRMLGAAIGKAMGPLDSGTGVIEALVTLQ